MSQSSISRVLAQSDELIRSTTNEQNLVGLGIGIVHRDEVIYARGVGFANAVRGQVVTLDTIFCIASISKTFTAIGLMQLWEQGAFQLDDSINAYLKAYHLKHRDPMHLL